MALGLMCQFVQPRTKRDGSTVLENIIDEKLLQLGAYKAGKYSEQKIQETYRNNVDQHIKIVPELVKNNIKSFRMTSNMLPLYEFCHSIAHSDESLIAKFKKLGNMFKENGIRVTCHPGQFTVISSDEDRIVQNSIRELEYHAWMFDQMGFERSPHYAINIHGGKSDRTSKLIDVYKTLPDSVKSRLTLENDESSYDPRELLYVSEQTGVPVVLDTHHYTFNTGGMTIEEAFNETLATWGKHKPLQHLSNTEIGMENGSFTERRKHSDYIHSVPQLQLEYVLNDLIDIDIEAKAKNLALLEMRRKFSIPV
jgi:UV DNA damage endonuclease